MNARSILGKLDTLKILLGNLHKALSVIGVSETWLSELTCDQVNIPDYKFVSNDRAGKSAGGTGLYLQENADFKILTECNHSNPDVFESLFVEITNPTGICIPSNQS